MGAILLKLVILFFLAIPSTVSLASEPERSRGLCLRLFSILNGDSPSLDGLRDTEISSLFQTADGILRATPNDDTPTAYLQRMFDRDYSLSEAEKALQRWFYLRDDRFQASLDPGQVLNLVEPLASTIRAKEISPDLVLVQVDYTRQNLLSNIAETAFFNLAQMLVPLVYRRDRLVADELVSTLTLMDRVLDSTMTRTYFFGFHPTVWRSYVRRLNRIVSENPGLVDYPWNSQWQSLSDQLHAVWQPLYPSYMTIVFHPLDKDGQSRRLEECKACTVTFAGLVRNNQPDPLQVLSESVNPTNQSSLAFYRATIRQLPLSTRIELQSRRPALDRFYQSLGFQFLRNEPTDPSWPNHPPIKTFSGARDELLDSMSRLRVR
jgi:hypothetical protein